MTQRIWDFHSTDVRNYLVPWQVRDELVSPARTGESQEGQLPRAWEKLHVKTEKVKTAVFEEFPMLEPVDHVA